LTPEPSCRCLDRMPRLSGIIIACLLIIVVITYRDTSLAMEESNPVRMPSYAGFAEIDMKKNSFILIGDTQRTSHWEFWREKNDKERRLIIDEITRRSPAFVVHLGDLTTRGSSEKHWEEFDEMHRDLRKNKIPYFPILGNHEFYGNDQTCLQNYFGRFPHLEQRRWYSFNWKNIAFIMVDSNFSTLTKTQIKEQNEWYLSQLQTFDGNNEIDYIIVCSHEPPFTNSRVIKPNKDVESYFANPFLQIQKTVLFFSGHCHSYERFEIHHKFFIVSGGGGGPRHKLTINPLKRHYEDLFTGPEVRFFHFCELENEEDGLHFLNLTLQPDNTFKVLDPITLLKNRA
jgi:hypothetical protein